MSIASSSWEIIGRHLKRFEPGVLIRAVEHIENLIPDHQRRFYNGALIELRSQGELEQTRST